MCDNILICVVGMIPHCVDAPEIYHKIFCKLLSLNMNGMSIFLCTYSSANTCRNVILKNCLSVTFY